MIIILTYYTNKANIRGKWNHMDKFGKLSQLSTVADMLIYDDMHFVIRENLIIVNTLVEYLWFLNARCISIDYVNIQHNYVNMQHIYVDMKEKCNEIQT